MVSKDEILKWAEVDYKPMGKLNNYDFGISQDGKFTRYDIHDGGPDGINAGYLTTKPDLRGQGTAFDGLYIDPKYRGQGLAKALLQKGLELHPNQPVHLRARPYKDKGAPVEQLLNLYKSVGFKQLAPESKVDEKYPVLKYGHELVFGTSGAGKTTKAKELAKEKGLAEPISLDRYKAYKQWRRAEKGDQAHLIEGTDEHKEYMSLCRSLVDRALARKGNRIIEGTQLAVLGPQELAQHNLHLVDPPLEQVKEQALKRSQERNKDKGLPPMTVEDIERKNKFIEKFHAFSLPTIELWKKQAADPNPGIDAVGAGWKTIESEIPEFNKNKAYPDDVFKNHLRLMGYKVANENSVGRKVLEWLDMQKQALHTERMQRTETVQVNRKPSAVVVRGNDDYIRGNHMAKTFYNDIVAQIRTKGYTVSQTKGEESGQPPGANLWVTHGGYNPPKGTKVLVTPQYRTPFMTKRLIAALDKATPQK